MFRVELISNERDDVPIRVALDLVEVIRRKFDLQGFGFDWLGRGRKDLDLWVEFKERGEQAKCSKD